jgi:truncated hemoglobin YjbI
LENSITPYELLGGEASVSQLVHRFYELMDELPEAYTVRQLHPFKQSLLTKLSELSSHMINSH